MFFLSSHPFMANGVAFHPSATNSNDQLKSSSQIVLTNLINRTMLQAMLTFLTKPENLNNAALKMRSGGKAGYMRFIFYLIFHI